MAERIAVIDFETLNLDHKDEDIEPTAIQNLGSNLVDVFSKVGFAYLINHGISTDMVELANRVSANFFELSDDVKRKFIFQDNNHGWLGMEQERSNPMKAMKPGDLKEAYNMSSASDALWPEDDTVRDFKKVSIKLMGLCERLASRVLWALGVGLKLHDPLFFIKHHQVAPMTILRYNYYPAQSESSASTFQPGQIRCGEHTDFGSVTLLFQDDAGGLQALSSGEWIDVSPIPGSVVVNIGDLMQKWTGDKLVSTMHRVLNPQTDSARSRIRRSIAYFSQPNTIVECVDGSCKYKPFKSMDWFKKRLDLNLGRNVSIHKPAVDP